MQGIWVWSLSGTQDPITKSLWATTWESMHCNKRSPATQQRSPVTQLRPNETKWINKYFKHTTAFLEREGWIKPPFLRGNWFSPTHWFEVWTCLNLSRLLESFVLFRLGGVGPVWPGHTAVFDLTSLQMAQLGSVCLSENTTELGTNGCKTEEGLFYIGEEEPWRYLSTKLKYM